MFNRLDRDHAIMVGNALIVADAIACAAAILAINPKGDVRQRAATFREYAELQIDLRGAPKETQQAILKMLEDRLTAIEQAATG